MQSLWEQIVQTLQTWANVQRCYFFSLKSTQEKNFPVSKSLQINVTSITTEARNKHVTTWMTGKMNGSAPNWWHHCNLHLFKAGNTVLLDCIGFPAGWHMGLNKVRIQSGSFTAWENNPAGLLACHSHLLSSLSLCGTFSQGTAGWLRVDIYLWACV